MFQDPRAPFRTLNDRYPPETHRFLRWERVTLPSTRDGARERERFELDTLAQRRAPAARPSWFARIRRSF